MEAQTFPFDRGTSVGLGIAKAGNSRQEQQAGTGTQAMNVDHEDELRKNFSAGDREVQAVEREKES